MTDSQMSKGKTVAIDLGVLAVSSLVAVFSCQAGIIPGVIGCAVASPLLLISGTNNAARLLRIKDYVPEPGALPDETSLKQIRDVFNNPLRVKALAGMAIIGAVMGGLIGGISSDQVHNDTTTHTQGPTPKAQ